MFLLFLLFFTAKSPSAQEKYALLISPIYAKQTAEKITSRTDIQLLTNALSLQGFKPQNVKVDTAAVDKESFFSLVNAIISEIHRRDFFLLYFDMPLKNEPGQSDWWLELNNDPAQNISLRELSSSFNDASNRVNDPNLFFSLFNSELSVSVNNSLH